MLSSTKCYTSSPTARLLDVESPVSVSYNNHHYNTDAMFAILVEPTIISVFQHAADSTGRAALPKVDVASENVLGLDKI